MVTSHDVARLAGVSQATVSRALRSVHGTSPDTVAKVRAAATALGYTPIDAGRSLSTRRTKAIGVVAGELTNPFYPEIVEPIRAQLEMHGYRLLLIPDSPASPLTMERMADGTFDGAIVATAEHNSRLPADLAARNIPLVLANRVSYGGGADMCQFDNAAGASSAAQLVVEHGHRKIGVICGPRNTSTGREREEAQLSTLQSLGIPVGSELIAHGPFSYETGFLHALEFLSREDPPTALLCGNDVIAIGACNAISRLGKVVGRDVSVVGFDDIRMAAWEMWSLTTIRGDLNALAAEAVRLLLARIDNPDGPFQQITLPVNLVVRSSVGRATGNP